MPDKPTLENLWIYPPLAFARFGGSNKPLANYHWANNDYAARGTAQTVIEWTRTFRIEKDGNIVAYMPKEKDDTRFFDETIEEDGNKTVTVWRPLCPFFELHGSWSDGSERPLTIEDLKAEDITLEDVTWEVKSANRKAYHYTEQQGDLVEASLTIPGNDHEKKELRGISPNVSGRIVPPGESISFGHAQVIRPNDRLPELRLRITPPKGLIYAPKNLTQRDLSALLPGAGKEDARYKAFVGRVHQTLNPDSSWAKWKLEKDPRTNPGGLYAQNPDGQSLGFLDDSNDGYIHVTIRRNTRPILEAYARYTCCPPDFQPDRRPFVSVADGLTDAVARKQTSDPEFVGKRRQGGGAGDDNWTKTELEIADFMQRVRETMEASNLDHQNLRSKLGNNGIYGEDSSEGKYPFEPVKPRPGHPLPLLELGRANHARFLAYEVFKQRLALHPELFKDWIRDPQAERTFYNKQMPALMRGSDSYPMTLTQRQYELMKMWLEQLVPKDVPEDEDATMVGDAT